MSPALVGQVSEESEAAFPTDWSHHHLIFSKPATAEQAKRVQQDPRYWQQMARQSPATLREAETGSALVPELQLRSKAVLRERAKIKKDWSADLGSGASVGARNYPAKYSFKGTTANCDGSSQPDFVVYGTGVAGSSGQASILAYDNLYSGCSLINLGTAANFAILAGSTVTNTGNSVVTGGNIGISPGTSLTGFGPGVLTPPAVEHLGDPVAAQAEADAATAFYHYQGLPGATPIASVMDGKTYGPGLYSAGTLSLSAGATVTLNGPGTYIFQIGTTLTLNTASTVVLSGGATAGNVIWLVGSSATLLGMSVAAGDIVAYSSITLVTGASVTGRTIALTAAVTMDTNALTTVDTVPSIYWAYNTNGQVITSPVLSLDGTQVAFVQSGDGYLSTLALVKWTASTTETVASPLTILQVSNGAYPTCPAPCMTTLNLENSSGTVEKDSNSSVFYDYSDDTAYVGDDSGSLHKITPFFHGIPAEVRTGGWPVQVNLLSPTALNSPVYDYESRNVFVTDAGGFLYRVTSTTGVVTISGQLDFSTAEDSGPGIVQGPIVNSTAGVIYVFATSDGTGDLSGSCVLGATKYDCSGVFQLTTSFAAGSKGSEAIVGFSTVSGTTPNPLYIGAFDSTYENSANATGNLYVCGNTGGPPILYQIAIAARSFGTVNPGPVLSGVASPCSPVTDILNPNASGGAAEWMFASAEVEGTSSGCASGGCIFNFKDTPWQPSTLYTVGQEVLDSHFQIQAVAVGGTSGSAAPTWSTTGGGPTADGTVIWADQGVQSAFTPAAWAPDFAYSVGTLILDSNDNIERCIQALGPSGSSEPDWSTTPGSVTPDVTVGWENLGVIATAAMSATGGTSGIIMDNTVGSGTLAGASQIYFSTLGGGCGGTGDTNGCAVQASQSALQ
jgi:hypothetical protein